MPTKTRRVALARLKAEMTRLRAEGNPWALAILKNARVAQDVRRKERAGWTWLPPIRRPNAPQPTPSAQPGESSKPALPLSAGDYYRKTVGLPASDSVQPDLAPATIPPSFTPSARIPGTELPDYLKAQAEVLADIARDRRLAGLPVHNDFLPEPLPSRAPMPQMVAGESLQDVITRAKIAGYPTRGGKEVMLNSEWVSAWDWAKAVPK